MVISAAPDALARPVAPARAAPAAVTRSRSGRLWVAGLALVAALVAVPVLALLWQAARGSQGLWSHMLAHVLPQAVSQTAILLAGVGVLVTVIGTSAAWLVTAYEFPGRRWLEWLLLLPLAVPTYIIAYAYLDILHPLGPVQTAIRALLGFDSPRDFRLPDIRSMTGGILLLGLVLYPYVYLTTRAMFVTQAANLVEVSRSFGVTRRGVFLRVALPLARPAIAVGVSLALMEALNDIGATEFLGIRTLTNSIYTTWVTRSDLPGAAQIALVMLAVVVALVVLERWARRSQRYWTNAQRARPLARHRLGPVAGLVALGLALVPVMLGFVFPALHLSIVAFRRVQASGVSPRLAGEALNTVVLAGSVTALVVAAGLLVAFVTRAFQSRTTAALGRIAAIGYAMPGTVVAIGILIPIAALDRSVDAAAREWFGVSTGLLLIGSGAALSYAYFVRFLTIGSGGVESGLARLPRSYDHAARCLGRGSCGTLCHVHLPLCRAALASAALLVFVDCMKELPATLLLRPLNFETLATHLYGEAARGTYEEGAIAALLIVAVGTLPAMLLARIGGKAN